MKWILLALIFELLSTCTSLNIVVIGAGAAGLTSAKNALEQEHNVVIFEKYGVLGGIWYYTDETGTDKYGMPHTPMYQRLRTNTPHKSMEFPDFPFPKGIDLYPSHDVVWTYLNSYAEKFGVKKHIKYHHLVEKVDSLPDNKWEITVINLANNNETITETYDAIFVCTNMFSSPQIPVIKGADDFKGTIMHSRNYRKPESFKGEEVLVIGDGPSGLDIINQLVGIAKRIVHSSHFGGNPGASSDSISYKGNVKSFTEYGIQFTDGTHDHFSIVIYATGYKYSYPFLDENTGIRVKNKLVEPLYKQVLNIHHYTMAFIGIPFGMKHNLMYHLQARFALKYISGDKQLPPVGDMMEDLKTISFKDNPHILGYSASSYLKELFHLSK